MLGTLDFTGSEYWAPLNFLKTTALLGQIKWCIIIQVCYVLKEDFKLHVVSTSVLLLSHLNYI